MVRNGNKMSIFWWWKMKKRSVIFGQQLNKQFINYQAWSIIGWRIYFLLKKQNLFEIICFYSIFHIIIFALGWVCLWTKSSILTRRNCFKKSFISWMEKLLIMWNVFFFTLQTIIFIFWWICITKQSRIIRSINQTWFPWNKNQKRISNQLPNFYWWI